MPDSTVISDESLWRRLRSAGVPLRDDLPAKREALQVTQEGGCSESLMFSLPDGRTGYLLWVRAVSCRSNLMIRDWELALPWEDVGFQWLPDPLGKNPRDEYVFPGKHGLGFSREIVLNHLTSRALRRGSVLAGALLGIGWKPIPPEHPHGAFVKTQLSAIDQFDQSSSTDVRFFVDRGMEPSNRFSEKPLGKGLFERDEVPQGTGQAVVSGSKRARPTCTQGAPAQGAVCSTTATAERG